MTDDRVVETTTSIYVDQPGKRMYKPEKQVRRWFMIPSIILVTACIYYAYEFKASCVDHPNLDMAEWWGPFPRDVEPDESIKPYKIEFSELIVNDLTERLIHRRPLPPPLQDAGFRFGFNTAFMTTVLDFWQNNYNYKERESFLNKYNHYTTNIQGLDIHYIHVKPENPGVQVLPLLLIHGWPSSIREFYELIPLLTTPRPNQKFVFEVIVPSLPGFGFSQAPSRSGMGPIQISVVLNNLMKRIGQEYYYIHGGGLGYAIGSAMATIFSYNVLGLHANMPVVTNPYNGYKMVFRYIFADWFLNQDIKERIYPLYDHALELYQESGYFHIQATKPDTVGIGLSESPAGLAAYILEKFSSWSNLANRRAMDGGLRDKFTLTQLLDNVMIYWVSNSMITSMRHYVEYYPQMKIIDQMVTDIPVCGIRFKHGFPYTLDYYLQQKFWYYLRSTNVEDGGQFPAMELPKVLADDIYDALIEMRKFYIRTSKLHWDRPKNHPYSDESLKQEENKGCQHEKKKPVPTPAPTPEPTSEPTPDPNAVTTVYDFKVNDINGNEVSLDKYKGKVLIIVNVASQCGYTDTHYKQLNELHDKYFEKGLRILAFPCNQFGGQEPGNLNDIIKFTEKRNVKFDIFEKIEVNGENAHPLWKFLKEAQSGTFGNFIKWNFSKFIIDRHGVPVERFGPNVNPVDLEPYLVKYW